MGRFVQFVSSFRLARCRAKVTPRADRAARLTERYTCAMILAVAGIPESADARVLAAKVTGLVLADLNRKLAGILPRVLFTGLGTATAPAMIQGLEALGFVVLTLEAAAPTDRERVIARRIEFANGTVFATDGQARTHACPQSSISLLQRGARTSTTSEKVTTSERKLDVGRAVMSGGLLLTKTTEKTSIKTSQNVEAFLLVQRNDGEPDLMLYERRIDYSALGVEMQPASRGNLETVWTKLKAMAPALVDDRVSRPGFVSGLPTTANDQVDLALFLVALARRVGR